MRRVFAIAVLACGLAAGQGVPSSVTRAEAEVARVKELVSAGAAAPARLREAETVLSEERDAAVLFKLLYGKLGLEDIRLQDANDMVAAARRRAEQQAVRIARLEKLLEAGVASRKELDDAKAELESRRDVVKLAEGRARLFSELLELAQAEQRAAELAAGKMVPGAIGPDMEFYPGKGKFNDADFKVVSFAFEKEFGKPLPVSARGETVAHKALGYDHRGRVDVGLNPDTAEGLWLREYLTRGEIPYIAFRRKITGSATAPHIHLGLPSPRLPLTEAN